MLIIYIHNELLNHFGYPKILPQHICYAINNEIQMINIRSLYHGCIDVWCQQEVYLTANKPEQDQENKYRQACHNSHHYCISRLQEHY